MSKKKKFKNKFKAEILKQLQDDLASNQIDDQINKNGQNQPFSPIKSPVTAPVKNQVLEKDDLHKYDYVKKDLVKIALIVGFILLVLLGVAILNSRSEIMGKFADVLTKFLHLNL